MEKNDRRICHVCGGEMLPDTLNKTIRFKDKEIEIKGIHGYRCPDCGEIVYTSDEIRMIDKLVRALNDKPAVDVLNLDETAELLRVSNQTVYNMIRDGRIHAHKVGREWRFFRGDIIAYMRGSEEVVMAAKGGAADPADMDIIKETIRKRKESIE